MELNILKNRSIYFRVAFIFCGALAIIWFVWTWIDINYLPSLDADKSLGLKQATLSVKLFFPASSGIALTPEIRGISVEDQELRIRLGKTMEALFSGPSDTKKYLKLYLENMRVLNIFLSKEGMLFLNLSRPEQVDELKGIYWEWLALNSISQTVRKNFPEVKGLQLLFDGASTDNTLGHIDLSRPLQCDDSLVQD